MIRVCCYCERWESGGIESFLNNVLSRMDLSQVQVDIVAADLRESVFTQGLRSKGIGFYQLSGRQQNLAKNWKMFRELLEARQYDVVHFNLFQGLSLYYAVLAKRAGVPVRIAHSHNTALRKSATKHLKLLLHNMGKHLFGGAATHRWACSEAAADFLFGPDAAQRGQFRFIPNGIQTRRFQFDARTRQAVRRELNLEHKFVIGSVGRLCYQKNQEFLLDVFAEILKQRPDSKLLLVGEGDDRPLLEKKAAGLGIDQDILFYGVSSRVEELFLAMDVLAFPSRFEGLGIVAVEAQASGLNVVCSEHVPKEAYVTGLAHRQPLTSGTRAWAECLLGADTGSDRTRAADAVRQAGFDIIDVVKEVERGYGVI